jgi:hypothetical protein
VVLSMEPLSRLRIPCPHCNRILRYSGLRSADGAEFDRFACPHCGRSHSLDAVLAFQAGHSPETPAQLALPPGAVTNVGRGKEPSLKR